MSVPFAPPGDGGFPHVHFEWHCQNGPCAVAVCTAESSARGSRKGQELTPALGLVYRTKRGVGEARAEAWAFGMETDGTMVVLVNL